MAEVNQTASTQGILPGGCVRPPSIDSMDDLRRYIGKVVKQTKDGGKTWTYLYLDKEIFAVRKNSIQKEGVLAASEQKRRGVRIRTRRFHCLLDPNLKRS